MNIKKIFSSINFQTHFDGLGSIVIYFCAAFSMYAQHTNGGKTIQKVTYEMFSLSSSYNYPTYSHLGYKLIQHASIHIKRKASISKENRT